MKGTHAGGNSGDAPWSKRPDFQRGVNSDGPRKQVQPGIAQPGPVLKKGGAKRGKRISKNRTANDAAQAIRKSMIQNLKEYE